MKKNITIQRGVTNSQINIFKSNADKLYKTLKQELEQIITFTLICLLNRNHYKDDKDGHHPSRINWQDSCSSRHWAEGAGEPIWDWTAIASFMLPASQCLPMPRMYHFFPGNGRVITSYPVVSASMEAGAVHSWKSVPLTVTTLCAPHAYLNTASKFRSLLDKKSNDNQIQKFTHVKMYAFIYQAYLRHETAFSQTKLANQYHGPTFVVADNEFICRNCRNENCHHEKAEYENASGHC